MTGEPVASRTVAGPSRSPSELLGRFPPLIPPVSTARAAVTIVLRTGRAETEVLLIERAVNPHDPASGHVALPGGHVEERDGSLADTALRELEEEVGIPPAEVLDSLRYVRTEEARRFGLRVGIFAAELPESSPRPAPHSSTEVAHVFWLPCSRLAESRPSTRLTSRGELTVPGTWFEGHLLWGFTRRVLRDFFSLPAEDDVVGPLFAPAPPGKAPDASGDGTAGLGARGF